MSIFQNLKKLLEQFFDLVPFFQRFFLNFPPLVKKISFGLKTQIWKIPEFFKSFMDYILFGKKNIKTGQL